MAVLSDQGKFDMWAGIMRDRTLGSVSINKFQLKDAMIALDAWFDQFAPNINQAIPQPARSALTVKQKALLLMAVIKQRYLES